MRVRGRAAAETRLPYPIHFRFVEEIDADALDLGAADAAVQFDSLRAELGELSWKRECNAAATRR